MYDYPTFGGAKLQIQHNPKLYESRIIKLQKQIIIEIRLRDIKVALGVKQNKYYLQLNNLKNGNNREAYADGR